MKNATKGKIVKAAAIGIDVLGPLGATCSQFPIWIEKSSAATVSGLFLVFAILSCIPLHRQIKKWLKTPSVPVMFSVAAAVFIALRNIIDQMVLICVVGAIANVVGAVVYKVGASVEGKPDVKKEESAAAPKEPQGENAESEV
jgi:Na+/phosphate symporter